MFAIGCASRPAPPPLAFVDSDVFAAVQGRAYGRLQGDLDDDGVLETALIERVELDTHGRPEGRVGYDVSLYQRELDDDRWVWAVRCSTRAVVGDELDTLRWIELDAEQFLFVMASESNPDIVRQSFAVVEPRTCAVVANDSVVLRRPGYEVIRPRSVPGGVFFEAGVGVRIVDSPRVLRLQGADGDVELLVGVRERRLNRRGGQIEMEQGTRTFLRPLPVKARWLPGDVPPLPAISPDERGTLDVAEGQPDAIAGAITQTVLAPSDLPELGDVDEETAFAIRGGEGGVLEMASELPVVLLEIHHGCRGQSPVPLALRGDDATGYITGSRPSTGAFVRAAGRSHARDGAQRDLIALREPSAALRLSVAPDPARRCIREVRAFGFAERANTVLEP